MDQSMDQSIPFFTDDVLSKFTQQTEIYLHKNNISVLNKDGLIKWFENNHISARKNVPEFELKLSKATNLSFEQYQSILMINNLSLNQCKNAIQNRYILNQFDRVFTRGDYDVLVIVDNKYQDVNEYNKIREYTDHIDKYIKGFMVVNRFDCANYKDTYYVNIICSAHNYGTLLMGMYMYTLFTTSPFMQKGIKGIIELADGYKNIPGLCTYNKYGFIRDDYLIEQNCFDTDDNMPMSVDLSQDGITTENIINVAIGQLGKLPIVIDIDKMNKLCSVYKPTKSALHQRAIQKKIAFKLEMYRRNDMMSKRYNNNKLSGNVITQRKQTSDELDKAFKEDSLPTTVIPDRISKKEGCIGTNCAISGGKRKTRKPSCKIRKQRRKTYNKKNKKDKKDKKKKCCN